MQRASNWDLHSVTFFVEEHPLDLSGSLALALQRVVHT